MLIMWSSMYQYGDRSGGRYQQVGVVVRDHPWPCWKKKRSSCKAEVRPFPSTFGFRNVKLLILVTFPTGT